MKWLTALILIFLGKAAFADGCPDLSGHFKFVDQPWNGTIEVEQNGCESIKVKRVRQVPPSARYPLGVWTETMSLKADGRAYAGYADASSRAARATVAYHKTSWEDGRLVLRHFAGSSAKCRNGYAPDRADCHVTEYILNQQADAYAWTQVGLWFSEGKGHHTDKYALAKVGEVPTASRVARH